MIRIEVEDLGELLSALEGHETMSYPLVEQWLEELVASETLWSVDTGWSLVRDLCDHFDISYTEVTE